MVSESNYATGRLGRATALNWANRLFTTLTERDALLAESVQYIQHTGREYCHNSEGICNCGARDYMRRLRVLLAAAPAPIGENDDAHA